MILNKNNSMNTTLNPWTITGYVEAEGGEFFDLCLYIQSPYITVDIFKHSYSSRESYFLNSN